MIECLGCCCDGAENIRCFFFLDFRELPAGINSATTIEMSTETRAIGGTAEFLIGSKSRKSNGQTTTAASYPHETLYHTEH